MNLILISEFDPLQLYNTLTWLDKHKPAFVSYKEAREQISFETLSFDRQKLECRKYAKNHEHRSQVVGTNIKQQGREGAITLKT